MSATRLAYPDQYAGVYGGRKCLFPMNYLQLDVSGDEGCKVLKQGAEVFWQVVNAPRYGCSSIVMIKDTKVVGIYACILPCVFV